MKNKAPHLIGVKSAKVNYRLIGRRIAIFCMLVLAAGAIWITTFPVGSHAAPPKKVTAKDLIENVRRANAFVGKAIKGADQKVVSPKKNAQQPFFAALKKTSRNVNDLLKTSKDKKDARKFLGAMDRTGQSVNELSTAYLLSGIKNPKVDDGVKKLVGSFDALRRNYGKEAARRKKGGDPAPKEVQQAAALKDKYTKALAELTKLKGQAAKTAFGRSPANTSVLDKLINGLNALLSPSRSGGNALVYYTDLLYYEEEFAGSWYAVSSYASVVDPVGYASTFRPFNTYVADVSSYTSSVENSWWSSSSSSTTTTSESSSFSFSSSEYWSSYEETSVEISESYEVEISESEITETESYLEETSLEVSVDEYDVTLGDDDEAFLDHDDDGVVDSKDDDDDGDGIPDAKDLDDDGDGINDVLEVDTDDDGTPDALDDDDDNDGTPDSTDKDDDNDGIPDAKDRDDDNDNDGTPNDKDADDDNDGIPDAKDDDDDGDGIDDADDTDDDNDGVDDQHDADHDNDGDGI
nr:hypothetical protein [Acidobacteriota bacterium]